MAVKWCHNETDRVIYGTDSSPSRAALILWSHLKRGCTVGFCLRVLNFCVLIALGALFLAPVQRLDRSIGTQLPGKRPSTYSLLSVTDQDRFIAKLADVKEEIHTHVCHRRGFSLLRARDCGPASES